VPDPSSPTLSTHHRSVRHGIASALHTLRHGPPTDRIRVAWDTLHTIPGGRGVFSWIVGRAAPYSGSIGAEVNDLRVGYAQVRMRDRRRLRNHLRSLHAIALANLAEFTGNLALAYSIPGDARFIPTNLNMEYIHKARGDITAVCDCEMPADNRKQEIEITIDLRDADGTLVSRGRLVSLVGPLARK
jgi:uncharacterized protein (TIGR00369 family)